MPTLTVENRGTTSPAAGSRYRRFRPRLVLGYQQDLNSLIKELTAMGTVEAGTVLDSATVAAQCRSDGVLVSAFGPRLVRVVTHFDVDDTGLDRAIASLRRIFSRHRE